MVTTAAAEADVGVTNVKCGRYPHREGVFVESSYDSVSGPLYKIACGFGDKIGNLEGRNAAHSRSDGVVRNIWVVG